MQGTFKGKPFYLMFTGGSPAPAWKGLLKKTTSHVPQAIQYFGGTVTGMFYEGRCTVGKGKFGLVVDARPETHARIRAEAKTFQKIVAAYARDGSLPMKQTLIKTLYALGQKMMP
jgi:hypothetical protein